MIISRIIHNLPGVLAVAVFLYAQIAVADKIEVEHYALSPGLQLPFSEAVRVGNMVWHSVPELK
jgi:hypothetical protein